MATSSSVPLERGKACLRCRRRKMRCDGIRPTCRSCARTNEECEYTDQGPTYSQILERNVADLEARIRELEGDSAGSVALHDPHSSLRQANNQSVSTDNLARPEALSPYISQMLSRTIASYGPTFGFFLNIPRFLDRISPTRPSGDHSNIPSALLHALRLMGIVHSNDPVLKRDEPKVLRDALQEISLAMTNSDPKTLIDILQAEILLAYYFFSQNRKLEGQFHTTAAVSIAVASNLHKIHGPTGNGANPGCYLPGPRDDVEIGERITAFWTVFILDRTWTVVLRAPSVLTNEEFVSMQIEVPWPMDMGAYEQHQLASNVTPKLPVQCFLDSNLMDNAYQSVLAMRAKASILYERAANLAAQWQPNSPESQARFQHLDIRIEQFKSSLPSLNQINPSDLGIIRDLLVIHALCNCATIQLHTPFAREWDLAESRTLASANAGADVLRTVPLIELGFVDPIMGVLWSAMAQTLLNGLSAAKTLRVSLAQPPYADPGEVALTASLDRILTAMATLSGQSILMQHELANVQRLYSQI